jgi:hypothetical protein
VGKTWKSHFLIGCSHRLRLHLPFKVKYHNTSTNNSQPLSDARDASTNNSRPFFDVVSEEEEARRRAQQNLDIIKRNPLSAALHVVQEDNRRLRDEVNLQRQRVLGGTAEQKREENVNVKRARALSCILKVLSFLLIIPILLFHTCDSLVLNIISSIPAPLQGFIVEGVAQVSQCICLCGIPPSVRAFWQTQERIVVLCSPSCLVSLHLVLLCTLPLYRALLRETQRQTGQHRQQPTVGWQGKQPSRPCIL